MTEAILRIAEALEKMNQGIEHITQVLEKLARCVHTHKGSKPEFNYDEFYVNSDQ